MSNIVEADYTIECERTLPVIAAEIKIIEQNTARVILENGIQIGQRLQEAKEKVGHGGFGEWCRENLNYSQDTAQKFMRLAKEYGDENSLLANTAMSRNFSISNALSLLKVPEEDREKFAEEHPIEDMTNKALEEEIRKLKEEKEKAAETIEALRRTADKESKRTLQAIHEVEDLKRQLDDAKLADPEEVAKLQGKLAMASQAILKAKDDLKKEKDGRQKAIEKELEAKKKKIEEEIRKEAAEELQMEKDRADAEETRAVHLEEEIARMKKREKNAGNDTIIRFKVLVDQLQAVFKECEQCILDAEAGTDPELSGKMNAALNTVIDSFKEEL